MLTLKDLRNKVAAPRHAERLSAPKVLREREAVLVHKDVGLDGWLTAFESKYAVFQSGRRYGVFHVHDCRDYELSASHGKQM